MRNVEEDASFSSVLLLISTQCSHCASVMQILSQMLKQGKLARLEIINLEREPNLAKEMKVRSVPWIKIGDRVFEGALSAEEIHRWVEAENKLEADLDYVTQMLLDGSMKQVVSYIEDKPERLKVIVQLMNDADAKINIRLGIGVVLESFAMDDAMATVLPTLITYLKHDDARVRADACHYLSLTGKPDLISVIEPCLDDVDAEVREIAEESIGELKNSLSN